MTITEQKAFLRSYTGQAQTPADFAQRWQETAAALHPAVSCAVLSSGNSTPNTYMSASTFLKIRCCASSRTASREHKVHHV